MIIWQIEGPESCVGTGEYFIAEKDARRYIDFVRTRATESYGHGHPILDDYNMMFPIRVHVFDDFEPDEWKIMFPSV